MKKNTNVYRLQVLFYLVRRALCGQVFKQGRFYPAYDFRGSILLSIIVTIVVIATLTAAVVPMFTAATMNQVSADQGRKAFYLAESGFRYASGRFLKASSMDARMNELKAMHGSRFTLSEAGSFTLAFDPYWFRTNKKFTNAQQLEVEVAGDIPQNLMNHTGGGWILVQNHLTPIAYNEIQFKKDNTLTFKHLTSVSAVSGDAGAEVRLAGKIKAQSVSSGGTLQLKEGAWVFPERNANITLISSDVSRYRILNYERRIGSVLHGVTDADTESDGKWPLDLKEDDFAVLEPFLLVRSTGNVGGFERQIVYNVPIGWSYDRSPDGFVKEVFHEKFDSLNRWFTGKDASMGSVERTDDGALAVKSLDFPAGEVKIKFLRNTRWEFEIKIKMNFLNEGLWNFLAFNWTDLNTNLAQSWIDNRGALSYDVQVKIDNNEPYFMSGMGFRIRNASGNDDLETYGVSFMRQRQTGYSKPVIFGDDWQGWGEESSVVNDNTDPSGSRSYYQNDLIHDQLKFQKPSYSDGHEIFDKRLGFFSRKRVVSARYSDPFIIFWQRKGGKFNILAHRSMNGLGLTNDNSGYQLKMKPYTALMVRVLEGWEMDFTMQGKAPDTVAYGDILEKKDNQGKVLFSARIMGNPVLDSGELWQGGNNLKGKLLLSHILEENKDWRNTSGGWFLKGSKIPNFSHASFDFSQGAKTNWILVYVDGSGQRSALKWPEDGDWAQHNGMKLVDGWVLNDASTGYVNTNSSVLRTKGLVSPDYGDFKDGKLPANFVEALALITSSSAGYDPLSEYYPTSRNHKARHTRYDDFAIRLDQKTGMGFLPPIQQ